MKKCLMIQTKDNNKLFTHEKNLPQLIEFSKIFNAEISTVQIIDENIILDLEDLAPAVCEKKSQKIEYELIETKFKNQTRTLILENADKVKKYIIKSLLDGNIVSLKDLSKKYKNLSIPCLCNHFTSIRKTLEKNGHLFIKVGGGKYKITHNQTPLQHP